MNAVTKHEHPAMEEFNRKLAAQVALDHAEALVMDLMFDTHKAVDCVLAGGGMSIHDFAALLDDDAGFDTEPTDEEIIDVYVESFGGTRVDAVLRLRAFVGADCEVPA